MKIYHMIIGRRWEEEHGDTSTRREYKSTHQGSAPEGFICVGVCGYHEEPRAGYKARHDIEYLLQEDRKK